MPRQPLRRLGRHDLLTYVALATEF